MLRTGGMFDDATTNSTKAYPSKHRRGRRDRIQTRRKTRLCAVEDGDEGQAPPEETEAPPEKETAPSGMETLPAGALAAAPETPMSMGVSENYDAMEDAEKRCFEAYILGQMDSTLVKCCCFSS